MSGRRVLFLTLFVFLIALFPIKLALAAEEILASESLETIEGDIIAIDKAKNIIEVRWMSDTIAMRFENITLRISPSSALIKNANPIDLSDIETGDHATVRYAPNTVPLPQAISVDIEE